MQYWRPGRTIKNITLLIEFGHLCLQKKNDLKGGLYNSEIIRYWMQHPTEYEM